MSLSPNLVDRISSIRTIDLTTYGRSTGTPRRIEIWWFHIDERFIVTGTPGPRDWLANVKANPGVIVHAGGEDLPGSAHEVTDTDFRRRVFSQELTRWYRSQSELERLVEDAPMIEITL